MHVWRQEANVELCYRDNTSAICSGHGRCECGRCVCDAISHKQPQLTYSGDYCQCNNYNCDYHDGKICGGPPCCCL